MAKIKQHKTKGFTILDNHMFRDKKLSLKGRGMLGTLMHLPNNWEYSEMGLVSILKEGRDAVRSALKELELLKYLYREQTRNGKGLYEIDYHIFDLPYKDLSVLDKPYTDKPTTDNPTQCITKEESTKNKKELKEKIYKKKFLEFVLLTEKQYDDLLTDYGLEVTKDLIDRLNNYIGSTGKKYKSHYHTIKNWIRSDEKKNPTIIEEVLRFDAQGNLIEEVVR